MTTDWANNNNISTDADINSMYQDTLGRPATSSDYAASLSGKNTNSSIYQGIFNSDEYKNRGTTQAPTTGTATTTAGTPTGPTGPLAKPVNNNATAPGTDTNSLTKFATDPSYTPPVSGGQDVGPGGVNTSSVSTWMSDQATNPTLMPGTAQTSEHVDPNASGTTLGNDATVNQPKAVAGQPAVAGQTGAAYAGASQVDTSLADPKSAASYTAAQIGAYTPQAIAAQGTVNPRSLMQNSYADLMNFPPESVPDWAKGASAVAKASLASSGLANSSMAAGAITAALMQAALPIAQNDSKVFQTMDLRNLDNEQQAVIVNTQSRVQTMMSDQAATNAASQFNSTSENQTKQFFSSMATDIGKFNANQLSTISEFNASAATDVGKFNATQSSAISEFNAGEADSIAKFNSQLSAQVDQFNAGNRLIIDQSNTKWQRDVNTANTAADNAANNTNAANRLAISNTAMNNIWQNMKDQQNYAQTAGENAKTRATTIAVESMHDKFAMDYLGKNYDLKDQQNLAEGIGGVASNVINKVVDIVSKPSDSGITNTGVYDNTTIDPFGGLG